MNGKISGRRKAGRRAVGEARATIKRAMWRGRGRLASPWSNALTCEMLESRVLLSDTQVLIPPGAAGRFDVPTSTALEATWTGPTFNDSGWANVITGVGFQNGSLAGEAEPNGTTGTANSAVENFRPQAGLYQIGITAQFSTSGFHNHDDWFKIGTLQAGDVITIAAGGSSSSQGTLSDPELTLLQATPTPAGTVVASDSDSGPGNDALIHRFTITATDTYYVKVSRKVTATAGSYRLGVWLEDNGTPPATTGTLTSESLDNNAMNKADDFSASWRPEQYRSRTAGAISSGTDVDVYQYYFMKGDHITVMADSTSSLDAKVSILNASGSTIGKEDGTSDALAPYDKDSRVVAFYIENSGYYYVKVESSDASTGAYNADVYLSSDSSLPYSSLIGTNVDASMRNVNATGYLRIPFTVADSTQVQSLVLRMRYDDGFIAYLNGVQVAARNAPASPTYNSAATAAHNTPQSVIAENIDISTFTSALLAGLNQVNVLAIRALNASASDSDLLIRPELFAGIAPPVPQIMVSEINYNPVPRADGKDLEFLELYNPSASSVDLGGYSFAHGLGGLTFAAGTTIGAQGYLVLARTPADVQSFYGLSGVIGYTSNLDNGGEQLTLVTGDGATVLDFSYGDTSPWPTAADGGGHSLVLKDPSLDPTQARFWTWSQWVDGSPGAAEPASTAGTDAVINEFLADPASGEQDFIELYNPLGVALDLGGYWLSDAGGNLGKFQIPAGTTLAPGEFVSFDQSQLGFDLSAGGGDIYLVNPTQTRVVDAARSDGDVPGVSQGQFPDGSGAWTRLATPTPGSANQDAVQGSIVINEIMYHPADAGISPPVDNVQHEYVELYNAGASSVDLAGWRIRGIEFTFDPAVPMVVAPGAYVVVAADTAAFTAKYGSVAMLVGGYGSSAKLSNSGETLELVDNQGRQIDVVAYQEYAPWPVLADNHDGAFYRSIELVNPSFDNDSPRNWKDSARGGTPGAQNSDYSATAPAWIHNVRMSEDLSAPGPNQPEAYKPIVVTAQIQGAANPVLTYILNNWGSTSNQVTVPMVDDGSAGDAIAGDRIYTALIPEQDPDVTIRYKVTATSVVGGTNPQYPIAGDTNQWLGTVVWNPQIREQSNAPVFYWLKDPNTFYPPTPGTGDFFYNGQFFQGVTGRVQGNISDDWPPNFKLKYELDMPVGHPLTYIDPEGNPQTVKSFRLLCSLEDKTYSRQISGYRAFEASGMPASQAFNVRIQMGNQFFGSYIFAEEPYEHLMDRNGLSTDNAIYKAEDGAGFNPANVNRYEKKSREWDTSKQDLIDFETGLALPMGSEEAQSFLFDNANIPNLVDYMAVFAIIGVGDNLGGKNYTLWRDSDGTGWWGALAWDMDTALGAKIGLEDGIGSPGWGSFTSDTDNSRLWNRLYTSPRILEMIKRRVRTLMDTWVGTLAAPKSFFEDIFAQTKAAIDNVGQYHYKTFDSTLTPQVPDSYLDYTPGTSRTHLADYAATDATLDQDKWGWKDIANWRWPGGNALPSYPNHNDYKYYYTVDDEMARVESRYLNVGRTSMYANAKMPSVAQVSAAGMIQIQDIVQEMFLPASGNADEQYLVIHNPDASNAWDLSGWTLTGPGFTCVLPGGTVLDAGGDLYVAADPASFLNRTTGPSGGQGLFVSGGWTGRLARTGGTVTLTSADSVAVASVNFAGAASAAQQQLRITEVMYNPAGATSPYTDGDFEFIELQNVGVAPLPIGGSTLAGGIDFVFPTMTLAPGDYTVVVSNPTAFASRYPNVDVAGIFNRSLNNAGDQIQLLGPEGEVIEDFTYSDAWYPATDGAGSSLVVVDALGDEQDPANWRASRSSGGSPGADESTIPDSAIVVNEVMANTSVSTGGWIEVRNTTTSPIDIGGWYLSDTTGDVAKYRIASGTVLPAGGYVVFTESVQFGNAAAAGVNVAFTLSADGGAVVLSSATADGLLNGYRDEQDFGASEAETSFGRYVLSTGAADFVLQTAATSGSANAGPVIGPLVIDQIMYHPIVGGDEYLRLRNIGSTTLSLFDLAHPANTWQFTNGIEFAFPAGATVAPDGYILIVGTDPAAFRTRYGVPSVVQIFGPFTGALDNAGESVALSRPGAPRIDQTIPQIVVEHVHYADAAPWPAADGNGSALARLVDGDFGNDPANWTVGTLDLPMGSITGVVFNDASGEGSRGKKEKLLAGRTIFLDANGNGKLDAGERSAVTDAAGRYLFDDVLTGTCSVRPLSGKGWRISAPATGAYSVIVATGAATNVKALGLTQKALISGTVFRDANGNKKKDVTEKGMAKYRVYLDRDNDGVFDSSEQSVLTDKLGGYSFKTLAAGKYVVRLVAKAPYRMTMPSGGVYKLTLKAGGVATKRDFGQK